MTEHNTITLRGIDVTHRHPRVKRLDAALIFYDHQDGTLFCDGNGKVYALGSPVCRDDGHAVGSEELQHLNAHQIRITVIDGPSIVERTTSLLQQAFGRLND